MVDRKINVFTKVTGAGAVKGLSLNMGALLAVVGLVAAALVGLTKAALDSAKKFLEFEKSVIKINVLLSKTERKTADVKERLLELRKAVPTAEFEDLSDSVFTLQSLLGDTEAAFKLAELAAKAGAATNTDVSAVTKALATNIKIFNLNTEESVAWLDKYVKAVNSGIITGEKLSKQVDEGAIAMNRLGASTEETLAVYSTLGGALREEAIKTGLKALANEVLRDKEKFEEAGVATSSFIDLLNSLEGKDLATLGFQGESIQLLEILVASKDQYLEMVDTITNSEGELADTFSAVEESASYIFDRASANVDDFKIRAGENFAEIGAAFITSMEDAGIDVLFEDILEYIEDITPILIKISEIIGEWIGDAVVFWVEELNKVDDLLEKIQGNAVDTSEELSQGEQFLNAMVKEFNPLLMATDQFIDSWRFIVGLLNVAVESIRIIQDEIAGLTLFLELVKGGAKISDAFKITTQVKEQLKTQRILEGDFGDDELAARIAFEERLGEEAGKAYWKKWMGERSRAAMEVGPLPAQPTTVGGIGAGGAPPRDDGGGVSDAKDRLEIEEEIQGLRIIGLESLRAARIEEDRARRKSEKDRIEAEKDAQKRVATGMSKAIVSALFSGDVAGAFKSIFGELAQKLLTNAMSKGIGALLSLIPGVGGFLGAIFGAEGFAGKGILQLAGGGAFSQMLTKATPAIIGEGRSNEIAAALPLDRNGSKVLLNDVLPNFPDVVSAIKGSGGQTIVNINPSISPLIDIEISERNIRGQRMRSNDIAQ